MADDFFTLIRRRRYKGTNLAEVYFWSERRVNFYFLSTQLYPGSPSNFSLFSSAVCEISRCAGPASSMAFPYLLRKKVCKNFFRFENVLYFTSPIERVFYSVHISHVVFRHIFGSFLFTLVGKVVVLLDGQAHKCAASSSSSAIIMPPSGPKKRLATSCHPARAGEGFCRKEVRLCGPGRSTKSPRSHNQLRIRMRYGVRTVHSYPLELTHFLLLIWGL